MDEILTLDARGLLCPLPVLKARKAMKSLAAGASIRVLTDDPAALIDFPHFCGEEGHAILDQKAAETGHVFVLRKGG